MCDFVLNDEMQILSRISISNKNSVCNFNSTNDLIVIHREHLGVCRHTFWPHEGHAHAHVLLGERLGGKAHLELLAGRDKVWIYGHSVYVVRDIHIFHLI